MPFYPFICKVCGIIAKRFVPRNTQKAVCLCGGDMDRGLGTPLGVRAMETADARRGISVPQGIDKMIEERAKDHEKKGKYSEED